LVARAGEVPKTPAQLLQTAQAVAEKLNAANEEFVIGGATAMILHGIADRGTGDVDVAVPAGHDSRIKTRVLPGGKFKSNSKRRLVYETVTQTKTLLGRKKTVTVDVEIDVGPGYSIATRGPVMVKGLPLINLLDLLDRKCAISRHKKDRQDMGLIAKFLKAKRILTTANVWDEVPHCGSEPTVRKLFM
jgi:hypothetical protein